MKHLLSLKFIASYILIGICGFFLVNLGGSYLVERYLERDLSDALYKEAHSIASYDTIKNNLSAKNLEEIRESLSSLAVFQDTVIWIINSKGDVLFSSRRQIDPDFPVPVESFDVSAWGKNYYQIGTFYGYFPNDQISVIAPITSEMTTKGYVAIHYQASALYRTRSTIMQIMLFLFFLFYGLTYFLILIYKWQIYRPLQAIICGASEYANGNLCYSIPVNSDDELGYLANTLNYMSDKLNMNGEYQRNFVSNVSHDFRSPLTSIKGYVEAILDGTIPPEFQEKYLKIIATETERLEKLTRSLLTLNEIDIKQRMIEFRPFDINDTLKSTAAFFEGVCTPRKIRLELLLSGKELSVNADREKIQQVLYNLLDNAIKFSPDDSTIVMETTEKNRKVFVSVKDHGEGIPRESIPKIWDRFYKHDASRGRERKSTGLGLSIVKEIINAHQQHIDVVSTPGVGTEFIFTLEKTQ